RNKIKVIEGDLDQPLCGIATEDIEHLKANVDIVVNLAGVVDFDPPVNESFETNVFGVQHLIELVKLLNAKLVHVSTSYVAGKKDGRVPENVPIDAYFPLRDRVERQFSVSEEIKWYEAFIE